MPLTNMKTLRTSQARINLLPDSFLVCRFFLCALMLFVLTACEQQAPEFEEGQGTNTTTDPGGDGDGSGGGTGTTDVGGSGTASARLTWDIPQFRENNEALMLSEIAGYEIIYRLANQNSYSVITIADNNNSSHTINNLSAGNYEFMIAVFDTDGLYSDYSDPVIASLTAQ